MTSKEFAKLAMTIRTTYPREKILQNQEAVEIWFEMLKDIDYSVASAALAKWIATEKWSPTIADIREQSALIVNGDKPNWGEAWATLIDAIRKYGYMDKAKIIGSLDDITQECVKVIGLDTLLDMNTSEKAFRRKEFREIYENIVDLRNTDERLPGAVAKKIGSIRGEADAPALNWQRVKAIKAVEQ